VATAAYEHAIAAADHAWRAGARLDPDTGVGIHELVIDRALTRSAYEDVAVLAEHALHIARALPAEPEQLERQAMLWLHLAGAKGILNGQSSAAAMDAVQCALEIGSQIQGRGFYNATALRCLMLCAHGRLDEAQIIATGLLEVYRRDGEPAAGLAGDFALSGVLSLRGDVDALIVTGRHMLDNFPPPKTVSDPMHFFHPRVYCWMALGGAVRGDGEAMSEYLTRAMELAASRGDTFNILAARLTTIECAAIRGDLDGTAELADQVDQAFRAAGALQWAGAARIVKVWAQTLTGEHPDPSEAFTAFDELTCDGSTAMTPMFLALLADIEIHHGRPDAARRLLHRARTVAEATGEHAEDGIIAQRLQALSELEGRPRRTSARGGRQFRSPLPPHRAVGHQVEHVAETTGRDERDEPRPRPVGADFETTTEELA
jgi:hypothetical protein